MVNKYLILVLLLFTNIFFITASIPTVSIGNTTLDNTQSSIINTTFSSSANLWDSLDVPTDIPNSEYWYNHTLFAVESFIPYTGATSNVDLGSKNITSNLFKGKFNFTSLNNWISFDSSTLTFNESKLSLKYYNATQPSFVAGSVDGGSIADTQHKDGLYDGNTFNFSETSSSPGLDLRINFTNISSFNQGIIRYKTSSLSGAYPVIQLWNWVDSVWEDYPSLSQTTSFLTITQPVFDPSEHIGTGTNLGVVKMRLYKASNGNTNNHYYVDWIAISKGYGVPSGEEVDPHSLYLDGSRIPTGNFNWGGNNLTNVYSMTTTGNVGIGTNDPSFAKLVVWGSAYVVGQVLADAGTSGLPGFAFKTDPDTGIHTNSESNHLYFSVGNSDAMSIDNNGNVGIGTPTPLFDLDIRGNTYVDSNSSVIDHLTVGGTYSDPISKLLLISGSGFQLKLANPDTGGLNWSIGTSDDGWSVGGGKLIFIPNNDTATKATVVFTGDATVGINTTSPTHALNVKGTTNITGDLYLSASHQTWNGTCLNTYVKGNLVMSIGCTV